MDKSVPESNWADPADLQALLNLKKELQHEAALLYGPNTSILSYGDKSRYTNTSQSRLGRAILGTNQNLFTEEISEIG